ncbi:MAG: hypothetical protein ACOYOE_13825 [Chlorobium sp.]
MQRFQKNHEQLNSILALSSIAQQQTPAKAHPPSNKPHHQSYSSYSSYQSYLSYFTNTRPISRSH